MPYFFDIRGTNGETIAKASNGIVVKKPASELDICNWSRMAPIIGPTDVSGDRIVAAINRMPANRIH